METPRLDPAFECRPADFAGTSTAAAFPVAIWSWTPAMLRGVWNRLVRRRRAATVRSGVERERMSPAERDFADESIDDIQADEFVTEHLGATAFSTAGVGAACGCRASTTPAAGVVRR
jgi:hypothetical protein